MLVLLVMLVGGFVSAIVASGKNRSGLGWFVIGALFPLIGIILSIALPERPPEEPRA